MPFSTRFFYAEKKNLPSMVLREPKILPKKNHISSTVILRCYSMKVVDRFLQEYTSFRAFNKEPTLRFSTMHEFAHSYLIIIDSLDALSKIDNSKESYDEPYYQSILQHYQSLIAHALDKIVRLTNLLKRLKAAIIRLQFIANSIRNRISRSPTPQKKEPLVGGVKVGGKRSDSHVVGGLYPLSFLTLKHSMQL